MWPFSSSHATRDPQSSPPLVKAVEDVEPNVEVEAAEDNTPRLAITGYPNERLSIPFILRAPILMTTSFVAGFSLGAAQGAPNAAFRYRAENAHRMPTTQTGWFLYQKSKNYHAILGGVKEGVRFGGVLTGWATLFMVFEELIDQSRSRVVTKGDEKVVTGQRDAASTVLAAMSTAGLYSWKKGMDRFTAGRTAQAALKYSLLFGLVQDAAATVRGNRPAYIDWIVRKTFGRGTTTVEDSG